MPLPYNSTEVTPPSSPSHNQYHTAPARPFKQLYNTDLDLHLQAGLKATRTLNSDDLEVNIFAPTQYHNPPNPATLPSQAATSTKITQIIPSSFAEPACYPAIPISNPPSNPGPQHSQACATARDLLSPSTDTQDFTGNLALANSYNQAKTAAYQTERFSTGFQNAPENPTVPGTQPRSATADPESYRTSTSLPPNSKFSNITSATGFTFGSTNTRYSSFPLPQSEFGNAIRRNTDPVTNTTRKTSDTCSLYSHFSAQPVHASDNEPKPAYRNTVMKPIRSCTPAPITREWGTLASEGSSSDQEEGSRAVVSCSANSINFHNPSNLLGNQQFSSAQAISEANPQQANSQAPEEVLYFHDSMDSSQNPDAVANNGIPALRLAPSEMPKAQETRTPTRIESRRNSDSMDFAYNLVSPSDYTSPYRNNVSLVTGQGSGAPTSDGSTLALRGLTIGNGTNRSRINNTALLATYDHVDATSDRNFNPGLVSSSSSSMGLPRLPANARPSRNRLVARTAFNIHPTILAPPVLPPLYGRNRASPSMGLPRLSNAARPNKSRLLQRSGPRNRPTILAPPILPPRYRRNGPSSFMRPPRLLNVARPSMGLQLPRSAPSIRPGTNARPVFPPVYSFASLRGPERVVIRLPGIASIPLFPTHAEIMEGYQRVDDGLEHLEHLVRSALSNEQTEEEMSDQNDDAQERLRLLKTARNVNRNVKNEVSEHLTPDGLVHSGNRAGPTFQELALGHLSPEVPSSDNPLEVCTFCRFTCDFGISEEMFWLPREASAGLCNHCKPEYSNDSLGNWSFGQHLDLMLFEDALQNEMLPLVSRVPGNDENDETPQGEAAQVEIERVAKQYQVTAPSPYNTISAIDKTKIEKHRGPLFCRNQNWRQVNVHMARICLNCRTEKLNIIKHHHVKFSTIIEEIQYDENGNQIPRDPNNRRCMYCLEYATDKCDGCPLRLCCSCEVLLRVSCKKFLDKLFYYHHRDHHRNDAFLLRSDGGGF